MTVRGRVHLTWTMLQASCLLLLVPACALAPNDLQRSHAVVHRRSALSAIASLTLLGAADTARGADDASDCVDCRLSAGPPREVPAQSSPLRRQIDSVIASDRVVVFGKSWCPYCKKTAALFSQLGVTTTTVYLDRLAGDDGPRIQAELFRMTGQRTVPNVFVKGRHLGGNDDTQAAARSGALQAMLR